MNLNILDFPNPRDSPPPPHPRMVHRPEPGTCNLYMPLLKQLSFKRWYLNFSKCKNRTIVFFCFHCRGTFYKNKTLLLLYYWWVDWVHAKLLSKRRRRWCTLIWLNQTESNPSAVDGGGFFLERGGGVTNQKLYNLLNSLRLRNVIFFSFPVSHSLGLCITRADKFCTFNLIKSTQLCLIYMKVNIYLILHLNSTLKTHTFGSTFF